MHTLRRPKGERKWKTETKRKTRVRPRKRTRTEMRRGLRKEKGWREETTNGHEWAMQRNGKGKYREILFRPFPAPCNNAVSLPALLKLTSPQPHLYT